MSAVRRYTVKIEKCPIFHIILTVIPVVIGAVIYYLLLFKIDRGISDEIAGMVTTFGLPWPKWL